ncbi:MAG: DUF4281 domain-containing protein [Cyclobacteriaceae bacterium]|nr:DUF4281 domain-containing protein [Cyclobacteriaceae bacterium]
MTIDNLFLVCNNVALLGWLLLLFAPRWRWTSRIILSGAMALLLGAVYLTLIALYFGRAEGSFGSLNGVMKLFENKEAVMAGWVHYLAFDLFVGTWIVSNSQKLGIKHGWIIPCLFFTFMFGPIGLILYYFVRAMHTKKVLHENF